MMLQKVMELAAGIMLKRLEGQQLLKINILQPRFPPILHEEKSEMKSLSPAAILIVMLFSFVLFSCGSVKEPEFRGIENVRIKSFGLTESTLDLNLHYFNPNNSRLKLKKAEGDAWIDEKFLGHFIIDTLVQIPANGDFRLPVKLQIGMKSFFTNSLALLLNNEVLVKIEGEAKLGKAGIFINYPIRYEGKQNLREMIKDSPDSQ